MLRSLLKNGLIGSSIFSLNPIDRDTLNKATETEKHVDASSAEFETGWDRVKQMYQADEFGNLTPELVTITHVGAMSLFVGAVYGGFLQSRFTITDFIKNNQATAFNDHIHAKKKLHDAVTKSFARGAWKWSWRLSLFCTSFMGISTTISVYRGKSGIFEYVAAGLISGTLYKFNAGPRGWIVGGGLGSALGLMAGCVTVGLLKLTGMSMDDVHYWQHRWQHDRTDRINRGISEIKAKEEGGLYYYHDQKISETGKQLETIEKQN